MSTQTWDSLFTNPTWFNGDSSDGATPPPFDLKAAWSEMVDPPRYDARRNVWVFEITDGPLQGKIWTVDAYRLTHQLKDRSRPYVIIHGERYFIKKDRLKNLYLSHRP